MAPMKRSASPGIPTVVTRTSQFHSSVTLYELPPDPATPSSRRSKRLKTDPDIKEEEYVLKVEDIEDAIKAPGSLLRPSPKLGKVASRSPKKQKAIQMNLDVPHPAPEKWEEVYKLIQGMREGVPAPVDTMGCDSAYKGETDPKSQRLSTLIALMMSSQTKDEVTSDALSRLRMALGGSITLDKVIQADENVIATAIAKVGFWRRKTQYIRQAALKLRDEFDSDVPKTVDDLCSLPGVGPKMAFLAMHAAWDINVGIGVDVHVHRISNRLGWHKPPSKTPEETRLNLQSWLPRENHKEINHLLVGFGQTICVPVRPRCEQCKLSNGLCPSASFGKAPKKGARKKTIKKTEEEDEDE